MEKNKECYPITPPECPVSPLANYVLSSQILANNAPADGASLNGVRFTLSSPVNLPVANQALEFSITGSAILVPSTPYTNNNGIVDVVARNFVPETVQLFGNLVADETVSANSLLTFIPTGPVPTYELTSRIIVNDAPANGSSRNEVEFYLSYGGAGVAGQLRLYFNGTFTELVTTAPNGFYTASFGSAEPGPFSVTAEVENDRSVSASETVTFTPVAAYPIYLGSLLVVIPLNFHMGIESLISPFEFIAGHTYRVENIGTGWSTINYCTTYAFQQSSQSCSASRLPDFTQLQTGSNQVHVRALNSGQGVDLRARLRYYWNLTSIRQFVVQVYDDGPDL
ncbi:hypothetical protein ABK905_25700 [Acerihabitans sp. KWT182]|uniref:Big-1 domain-containing protein n=1 Tax=Acerihabitans sp. KWT182 TaxID=3157919 RepID=A0AAU7Q8X8_9GAMM